MTKHAETFAAQVNAKIRAEQERVAAENGITVDELMERVIAVLCKARSQQSGVVVL